MKVPVEDNLFDLLCPTAMSCAIGNLKLNRRGLERYNYLQRTLLKDGGALNPDFQRAFKSFYRVRRSDGWCEMFFTILDREKHNLAVSFRDVLAEIHCGTKRVEASFASKLVATINANRPVWDRHVLDNMGLKPPHWSRNPSRRLRRCEKLYEGIRTSTSRTIRKSEFEEWRSQFDDEFPQFSHFTDIKKLDLLLWQSRPSEPSGHASGKSSPGAGGVSGAFSR